MEYKYEDILFSQSSKYQDVMIVDTLDHGRALILDGLVNLAEKDTSSYTQTLMFDHDFNDKEVLILGGGDGGLLKEILDHHSPRWVTMIELDEVVINAVKEHMPSVCGQYLDTFKGSNYEVIVGDAFDYMEKRI
ncbi:Spermine synthaselike, partial [Caligus rogercresseyi]